MCNINKDWFIGALILEANEKGIKVVKDNKTYTFNFVENDGYGCGFNRFKSNLLYEKDSEFNPVIVDISESTRESGWLSDGSRFKFLKLTLLGQYKPLGSILSMSGTYSGYPYGACVSLVCDLDEEQIELELTKY